MSDRVRITEVGPRDGLQNESGVIPTESKIRLVELCARSGVDEVEVTSFVSPKWVPQLGDGSDVLRGSMHARNQARRRDRVAFSALVPNDRGMASLKTLMDQLGTLPVDKVSVFTAASETFNRTNTNATVAESIQRFQPVVSEARRLGLRVRGYVSCVVACPFEGAIAPDRVCEVARMLVDVGVDEIDLGDTIGAGRPESIGALLLSVRDALGREWWTPERMALHLHDTFGRAEACVRTGLDLGVRSFDGSVAGLGGCPYASTPERRAPGNISTETLVRTIRDAGLTTGVDEDALGEAAAYARSIVAKSRSQVS